ncbi:23S rRNA (guanosine(2251)-2'-O)-methyltransferase RlmB [Candidatus Fukatsuia anoeciicola]|uniref:23S rRNA (guanosine(2251)-2'-O)-methyltransferase RlmB n=1 Tax=Candidatus Fukatsuia anoeciicola TaxID=2994492 RepID=UPI0034638DC8
MSEIIYGIHTIKVLLDHEPQRFLEIFIQKNHNNNRLQTLVSQVRTCGLAVQYASRKWLDSQTKGGIHQNIVARVRKGRQYQESDLLLFLSNIKIPFLLILDGITDPHNLGACLRSADAAGVDIVIIPRNRSASLNATVKKVASGAAENVPLIQVTNLARTLQLLKEQNIYIVGTSGKVKENIYQNNLTGPIALVMGSEGRGMNYLTRKYCDKLIRIPMVGIVYSLNISVAAGVCLFEVVRQRSFI